jgi:small subunit ribosomal protein S17
MTTTKNDKIEATKTKSAKSGVVISDKMDKTIVVKINRLKKHPRYQKRYISSEKYKVHDEQNKYSIGDKVLIKSCRPISKDKKWEVVA